MAHCAPYEVSKINTPASKPDYGTHPLRSERTGSLFRVGLVASQKEYSRGLCVCVLAKNFQLPPPFAKSNTWSYARARGESASVLDELLDTVLNDAELDQPISIIVSQRTAERTRWWLISHSRSRTTHRNFASVVGSALVAKQKKNINQSTDISAELQSTNPSLLREPALVPVGLSKDVP